MWMLWRREPYRLFFPLGIGVGMLGAGHWLAYAAGWQDSYSGFFHASVQTGAFVPSFILGFLLTALPRFAAAPQATNIELAGFLGLVIAQVFFAARTAWILSELCVIAWLISLAVFAGRRFARKRAEINPPTEFVWIPVAVLFGLIGNALLIGGQLQWLPVGVLALARPLAQQGFLLALVVGIAGFMAPRLMGRGFAIPVNIDAAIARVARRRHLQGHVSAAVLLAVSFLLECFGQTQAGYAVRAAIITLVLMGATQFHRPMAVTDVYARLLRLSLWLLPLGYWGAALWPASRIAMLHLAFLGGFSLMAFAVGTMVAFSHAGEAPALRNRHIPLWLVGWLVVLAALLRAAADGWPGAFFTIVGAAAACWIVAGVLWLLWLGSRWWQTAPAAVIEQHHEEAKARATACNPKQSAT